MSSGQLTYSVITKLDTPVLYPGALFKRIDLEFAHHTHTRTHTHTHTQNWQQCRVVEYVLFS